MKLILCLIFLIIVSVNCETFLNFIPYDNEECSGNPSGLGYSGVINTCLTYDDCTNWIFRANQKTGQVSFTGFYNKGGVQEVCEFEKFNTVAGNNGDCVNGNATVDFFNSYYLPVQMQNTYYKLQVTNQQAHIEPNSYVSTLMYQECTESNVLAVSYFTSPTNIIYTNTQNIVTFECNSQNVPQTVECDDQSSCNTQIQTAKCVSHIPFFNSTFNYPSSSDSDSSISTPNFNNVYCS